MKGILSASLGGLGIGKEALYHPYLFNNGGKDIALFFRDHTLSDLIGFTYSQWEEQRAVADFIGRLRSIAASQPDARVVPIILDGENAWEYYPDNGYHFLKDSIPRWQRRMTSIRNLQRNTDKLPKCRRIHHIHPGSWINANYGIWIGHPEENRPGNLLPRLVRRLSGQPSALQHFLRAVVSDFTRLTDKVAAGICRDLFAAQGSDWFWWYGDDHFASHSDQFDLLFRGIS